MSREKKVNGVAVDKLGTFAESIKQQADLAKFNFRATNKWLKCGHNRTTIRDFYGNAQDNKHKSKFVLDADEPELLLGTDKGANPVEHLLNALVSCLTSAMVYHSAVRGMKIEAIESSIEGNLDVRGFMGISPDVRKGYQNITVTFRVKSDAPPEKLEECARFSPVFDVVSRGTDVTLRFEKLT